MTKIITVVGANGDLGLRVCRELLKQNVKVKAVIRNKSKALDLEKLRSQNPEITNPKNLEIHCVDFNEEKLRSQNPEIINPKNLEIHCVDFNDEFKLCEVFANSNCVVSTISGLRESIIETQTKILRAVEKSGVKRFIPSDFAVDFRNIEDGSNRNLELRKDFKKILEQSSLQITSILNGVFSDMLVTVMPLILFKIKRVVYFQNPQQKIDFTTINNTAEFTAQVALDDNSPRYLKIACDQLSSQDFVDLLTKLTGKKFKLLNGGNLKMLKFYIALSKFFAPKKNELYPAWQGMQYFYTIFSGSAKMDNLDNERYQNVKWVKVEEILKNFLGI